MLIGLFMALIDVTIVNISIPQLQRDLDAPVDTVSWVLNAYNITFAVLLILWVINWAGSSGGPVQQKVLSYLSITEHFEDFSKGILDTKHIVYYLSFITFGLFLTAKSVDSERWRG